MNVFKVGVHALLFATCQKQITENYFVKGIYFQKYMREKQEPSTFCQQSEKHK